MRHTHLYIALALSLMASGNALAQPTNEQSLSHRLSLVQPGSMPTTNASARQGQWRIDWGHQRLKSTNIDTVGWFFSMDTLTFRDAKTNAHKDIRLGVSYTPWEHVTLGVALRHTSRKWGLDKVSAILLPLSNTDFLAATMASVELSAAYHAFFSEQWAWECRYALEIGRGRLYSALSELMFFYRPVDYVCPPLLTTEREKVEQRYTAFNHSLSGGVSIFSTNRAMQGTVMLSAAYTHRGKFHADKSVHNHWGEMLPHLQKQRGLLALQPALMLTFHARRVFSIQGHAGLSMHFANGSLCSLSPAYGLQFSWRVTNTHRNPTQEQ